MNNFHTDQIAEILNYPDPAHDDEIPQQVFDVIYSLGRDAENEEEFLYAYNLLLELCKRKSHRVCAYAILGLSLLALNQESGLLNRDEIVPIIMRELPENKGLAQSWILDAIDDFNQLLHWKIKVPKKYLSNGRP